MNVLVDTCIWSLSLRRNNQKDIREAGILKELIMDSRVSIIGAVRQELLSGISLPGHFNKLKDYLRAFPNITVNEADYECAAEYYNVCRKKGIQGSNTDFLICSVAMNRNMPIFTVDKDFIQFKKHIPILLYH
ncbi:MAG: PIN domain-containing protein [Candidatus Marinimicrobia bacterium]|jgi:hypothetical protein|nr:PIN domain-containing protein [Candidatus Neomarinimicrobiota bacterium]MBT3501623.1 PIN domain-containing protein [Candidatus Neomarinimicrobiota bacterium]MBT3838349.1 PIN domain-containing protein [Candidatus Neomarinimicrobiota bacterium]MBT3999624.1 PIN domain-containing protein [Candidatus Neomarinimicrobiota bacterium]MBT4281673.1 PIN domain-containing protein [Candidatus Neomarinimicrobiota bacterium]